MRTHVAWLLAASLPLACLEPNPNAEAGSTADTSTSGTTATTTADTTTATDTGASCDPCDFGFELVEFDASSGGTSGSVPKPDFPHTVALALVHEYTPGSSDTLGYVIEWTDDGSAWGFDVTLSGAANNSRVRGRAIVLGFNEPPSEAQLQVSGADGCQSASIDTGLVIVDAVERYEPGDATELSYARSAPAADAIEYCVTASSIPEASIGVKLIGFAPPDGITAESVDEVTLASQAPQTSDFPQIDGFAILHMLAARSFDEGAATNLGYAINCDDAAAPWTCSFDMSGFKAGAQVVVGGAIAAIP
jgi:hypothetical protein